LINISPPGWMVVAVPRSALRNVPGSRTRLPPDATFIV
jgi:hypothetical protein